MSLFSPFSRRLYLRIWLAVAGSVMVFVFIVGYAWRVATEHNAQAAAAPPSRELELLAPDGQIIVTGQAIRLPGDPEGSVNFRIETEAGLSYTLHMSPRPIRQGYDRGRERSHRDAAFWLRPPYGFLWMLTLVGIAVTAGVFPIIRHLLQRLESLQRGVQRFGKGDLSVRIIEQGQDEVADLARQFNAAAERIQTLVQSHKSLLANASHELRSPLTRIRMGLELMGSDTPSAAFRTEIERNIAELDQLVDEILLASRLDAGAGDVGTIEAIDLLGLAAEECMHVDAQLHATGTLEVHGVAKLLRRAIRNLLENARRYSQGEVAVDITSENHFAILRVCDRGCGVPAEQRERIFEPFYRLPGASERAGGVGLGLSLVRSIAQRHGGSACCQERPDGATGACFVLRLPLLPIDNSSGGSGSTHQDKNTPSDAQCNHQRPSDTGEISVPLALPERAAVARLDCK